MPGTVSEGKVGACVVKVPVPATANVVLIAELVIATVSTHPSPAVAPQTTQAFAPRAALAAMLSLRPPPRSPDAGVCICK